MNDIALLNCTSLDLLIHTTNVEDFKKVLGDLKISNELFVPEFLQYPDITRLFGDFNILIGKIQINELIRFINTKLLDEYNYIIDVIIEQYLEVTRYLNIFQEPDVLFQYIIHISTLSDTEEMIKKFIFLEEQLHTEFPVIFFTNEKDICKFKKIIRDIYRKGNVEFIRRVEEFILMYYTDIVIHDFFVLEDVGLLNSFILLAELCPQFKKLEAKTNIDFIKKDVILVNDQINFSILKRYLLYNNVLSECDKKTIMLINTETDLVRFITNFKYKYLIDYNITIPRIKLRLSINTKISSYNLITNILHNDIEFSEFIYLFENWKLIFDVPFKEEIKLYIVNTMIKFNDSKYIIWLHLIFKAKLIINEVECGLYRKLHSKSYDFENYGIQVCNNDNKTDIIYRLLFSNNKRNLFKDDNISIEQSQEPSNKKQKLLE